MLILPTTEPAGDDLALLRRHLESGDGEAIRLLMQRHRSRVAGVCRQILGEGAAVDDAVQETFILMLRHASGIDVNVGAWLHATARQVALNHRRSERRRRRHEHEAVARPDADLAPEEQEACDAELLPRLPQCLAELPVQHRELVERHYLKGETQASLSERYRIPLTTVHRRIHGALQRLRRSFIGC